MNLQKWALWIGVGLLVGASSIKADDDSSVPKKGTYYLSILEPYPATFGVGITNFFSEKFALSLGVGKGNLITYAVGLKWRPIARKLSPLFGINLSMGDDGPTTRKGFLYVNTGLDWKWDSGLFLHPGLNWSLTPHNGKTQMSPYLQFGATY